MSYELRFHESAKKSWDKLDNSIRQQMKKKLKERRENPHVPSARMRTEGRENIFLYKIKLAKSGFRLIYQVKDQQLVILVVAVDKRDSIYDSDYVSRIEAT